MHDVQWEVCNRDQDTASYVPRAEPPAQSAASLSTHRKTVVKKKPVARVGDSTHNVLSLARKTIPSSWTREPSQSGGLARRSCGSIQRLSHCHGLHGPQAVGKPCQKGAPRRGSSPQPPHYLIQWPGTRLHLSSRSFLFL